MRSIPLDVLRAIAVLGVFGSHLPQSCAYFNEPLASFIRFWMHCGWTGVNLFFVLSGFLVSSLLFKEYKNHHKIDLMKFFIRRGLKIYPAFYAFLALSTIIRLKIGYPLYTFKEYIAEIFYIQNYSATISDTLMWAHTWTLAVEEHFYLLLGFLAVYLSSTRKDEPFKRIVPISITCFIIILFIRIIHAHLVPFVVHTHLFPTHLRMDSLLFGVLLSYFYHFRPDTTRELVKKYKGVILIASLLLLASAQYWEVTDLFMYTFGFTLLYLGHGGLLMLAVYCIDEEKISGNIIIRILAKIGTYSYSIYLWHMIFSTGPFYLPISVNDRSSLFVFLNFFIYVGGSITVGILMSLIIEMPLLRVRDFFFPSRSGSALVQRA